MNTTANATKNGSPGRQNPQIQPCRYKVGKTLGAGSYSVVKECVHIDTGRYYAAKVINKRLMAGREHMVRNEIAVLKKVSMGHQNILTLVDYFETMNNLYLVTDLALGGELFDRICRKGSYYESDAADLIRATLSAVAYLHDHGIVHRDLKPENLLFRTPEDNADLLIADFGLSRIMDEEQFHVLTTTCGTPGYMAPEIFKKTGHGKPVDIWAMGVITYFLLCGYTPFDRDSDFEEMQAILNADYSFQPADYWRGVSDHAKDFIRRCLTVDPNRRMTAHEALSHAFVAPWNLGPDADGGDHLTPGAGQTNLLPTVKKNFNARKTLHAAIDTVRAINKLREAQAQAQLMDGQPSEEPGRGAPPSSSAAAPEKTDSGYSSNRDGDVEMGGTDGGVPASLRPGAAVNRVVETRVSALGLPSILLTQTEPTVSAEYRAGGAGDERSHGRRAKMRNRGALLALFLGVFVESKRLPTYFPDRRKLGESLERLQLTCCPAVLVQGSHEILLASMLGPVAAGAAIKTLGEPEGLVVAPVGAVGAAVVATAPSGRPGAHAGVHPTSVWVWTSAPSVETWCRCSLVTETPDSHRMQTLTFRDEDKQHTKSDLSGNDCRGRDP
ncbi:hypothetical protein DL771_002291 [Monosporascus sp. 5C6A]|nr:hypothetical protein DL771_002291 [Monosporascus sp. 5C6A]